MTGSDSAASTGIPAGTIKAQLSRGRTTRAGLLDEQSREVNDVTAHS